MKPLGLFLFASIALAQAPDLLLVNGNIVTLSDRQPNAEAIAIRGGRILWTGTDADAKTRFPAAARTVDLGGETVLPGILDVHTHLLSLGESFLKLNLTDAATPEEVAARVRDRAKTAAPGEWILGWGWDEGRWAAKYPTHQLLTAAAPNNPVCLTGLHGFASWVNRKALEAGGVTREMKDPENGKIVRDEKTGEATGVLLNRAQSLVASHIPPLTAAQRRKAIQLAAQECVRNGLTSVDEAGVSAAELDTFREMIRDGSMPLRVYVMLDGANRALMDEWLKKGPEIDRDRHGSLSAR